LKFRQTALLCLRSLAAFAALGGALCSLVWLDTKFASVEVPKLGPWVDEAQKIPLVLVDAGHGGHDGGAVANGSIEKHLTLAIANELRNELVAAGLRVKMTRDSDTFLPLEYRAALTAKYGAAVLVSVHINTDGSGSEAEGIETYFSGKSSLTAKRRAATKQTSEDLATVVQRCVCAEAKGENRGVKNRDYLVIEQSVCPAVLVECGFLTNITESLRLKDAKHQASLAKGIATGVKLFLQSRPTPPVVATVK